MSMGFHVRYVLLRMSYRVHPSHPSITSVNGCSLKTEDNLTAAKAILPEKLLLETGKYLDTLVSSLH